MFRHFISIFWRTSLKNKQAGLLNFLGLAVATAAALLIFSFVRKELSYDKHHPKYESLYRINHGRITKGVHKIHFASAPPGLSYFIKENFPQVNKVARIVSKKELVRYNDVKFLEEKFYYAEPEFINLLDFKFTQGSSEQAFGTQKAIIISEKIAHKYFQEESPIGKNLKIGNQDIFTVSGVFKWDRLKNHLNPELIVLTPEPHKVYNIHPDEWGHSGFYTYLQLDQEITPKDFGAKVSHAVNDLLKEWLVPYEIEFFFELQHISEIHLNSHLLQEFETNGNSNTVLILSIIGILILSIAWINYVNLSTARSINRSREIALKKVNGATSFQLRYQLFGEALVSNFIVIIFSLLIYEISLSAFQDFMHVQLASNIYTQGWFLLSLLAIWTFGSLAISFYPAFLLSRTDIREIVHGKFRSSIKGIFLKKALVSFQFATAILLISSSFLIRKQIKHLSQQEKGLSTQNIMAINAPQINDSTFYIKGEAFQAELRKQSFITNTCFSSELPGKKLYWDNGGIFREKEDVSAGKTYMIYGIDENFLDLYDMEVLVGRNFSKDFPSDKSAIMLSERGVKHAGFDSPEEAINEKMNYWGNIYTIIGVVKDFRQQSAKFPFEAHLFRYMPKRNRGFYSVQFATNSQQKCIQQCKDAWDKVFPDQAFVYRIMDEYYGSQFDTDKAFLRIFSAFSLLAILITIIGIYGLANHDLSQRLPEIAIRKILGSPIKHILILINKEYAKLALIGFVISAPLFYLWAHGWLQQFNIQTNVHASLLLYALTLVSLASLLAIVNIIYKLIYLNPVELIKEE